jgi:hypothetical protein
MQKKCIVISLVLLLTSITHISAQYKSTDSTFKKMFIGSTLFLIGNLSTVNPPSFFQLNLGYRLTAKDVLTLEPKTWKYAWPNGIHPFLNSSYGTTQEQFPGYVKEFGISLAYQRFFWKGLYTELNVMPTLQHFRNNSGKKLTNGFQVFNTYRVGFHVKLFNDKLFIQPSMTITHRATHTKLPDGFKHLDDKWSKFVFPEPGLHFGFNF